MSRIKKKKKERKENRNNAHRTIILYLKNSFKHKKQPKPIRFGNRQLPTLNEPIGSKKKEVEQEA